MPGQITTFFSIRRVVYCSLIVSAVLITTLSCGTESKPTYQLTTSSTPVEGGTVNPASGEFKEGDEVQLQATASENWVFDGWEGDQTGTQNPVMIMMDSDKSVNARFVKQQYPLTINIQGEGSVEESIVQSKMTDYEHGTIVQLLANSETGYEGYIGQEFIPTWDDKLAALKSGVEICDV